MITQDTLYKLRQMRLSAMADAFSAMGPDYQHLSFEERFSMLVDQEWTARRDRKLARLLKEARLRLPATPEDIDFRLPRELDQSLVRSLLRGQWIRDGRNLLIIGPTGVGKTFLACAFGNAACRQDVRTRYFRLPGLLSELELARADGSQAKLLRYLTRIDLLIIDDWCLAPISGIEAHALLDVIDARSLGRSTLISSQLPLEHWHAALADPTVADAILDRLIHGGYKIVMRGESMRKVIQQRVSNEQDN